MRLSKRQLKRIIREEYSRLKRQDLITEMMGKGYMINDAMGGPEDQSFPAGTTVQQAADQMVRDMQADYPGVLEELQSMNLSVDDLEMMAMDGMTDVGEAVAEAIEFMDIDGSGNFEFRSCITALHSAIYGRRSMAEARRRARRGLIKESSWQFNPAMGEDGQDCEEGTPIEQCAQTWGQYARDSFGDGAIMDIQDFVRPSSRGGGKDVIDMSGDDSEAGYACAECLEGMDINGSGNWPREEAAAALADVFYSMR